MASEPKKAIEQMLEALAKARRAEFGDDPKMPNPMRARLHEEIARAGAAEDERVESRASWVTMFWPRLAVAAALATLIVLVSSITLRRSHPVAESGIPALRKCAAGTADELNSAAAPAARPDSKAKLDTMAGVAPPIAPSLSAGSIGTKQQFSRQSAVRSFRNNAQVSRAANVLNAFQVEQHGSVICVRDADGSWYIGKIEELAKSAEPKEARRQDARAAGEGESAAPQLYFRVSGFNVSLKKTLVFEGNYAAPPAQQPAIAAPNDKERTEQSRDRARIVGTVQVNGEAPVEVDAIAETPESATTKKSEN